MDRYVVKNETLKSIADAIREKSGKAGIINVENFASEISSIESGGECTGTHVIEVDTLPTENIDENAVYFCNGKYYKYDASEGSAVYAFNETINFPDDIPTYVTIDDMPDSVAKTGVFVKLINFTLYGEDISGFSCYFTPINVNGANVYLCGDFGDGFIRFPCYITDGNGNIDVDELSGKTFEVIDYGNYSEWLNANATLISGGSGWKEWIPKLKTVPVTGEYRFNETLVGTGALAITMEKLETEWVSINSDMLIYLNNLYLLPIYVTGMDALIVYRYIRMTDDVVPVTAPGYAVYVKIGNEVSTNSLSSELAEVIDAGAFGAWILANTTPVSEQ